MMDQTTQASTPKKLIIATRGSALALWQSEHIKKRLEEAHVGLEV